MTQTIWLMLAIAVVAVVIGFLAGRLSAPRERQFQETRSELERVEKERDELRDSVESHFQHTAALFGNLSRDYRALYLHFAEGARSMGLGEEPARRLIEEAREPSAEPAAGPGAAPAGAALDPAGTGDAPAGPASAAHDTGERATAGTDTAPEAEPKPARGDGAAASGVDTPEEHATARSEDDEPVARGRGEAADGEARGETAGEAGTDDRDVPRRDAAGG